MLRQFTCIMCPMGCSLEAEVLPEGQVEKVTGNNCKRGKEYAVREVTNPVRNIASSVLVEDGELPLASVRLNAPIPKKDIFSVMAEIRKIKVTAPVSIGQIVLQDVLGTGSDVIITKKRKEKGGRAMKVVKGGTVSRLLKDVPVPEMFHARQTFSREVIAPKDIPAVVFREMAQPQFAEKIRPGMSIAVTAGSRGIRNVDIITKAVVDFVKQKRRISFYCTGNGKSRRSYGRGAG